MTSTTKLHPCGATWLKRTVEVRCPLATVSFALGLAGLPLFGVPSLPAIVSGVLARRPKMGLSEKSKKLARTGIALGFAGLTGWFAFAILIFATVHF